MRQANRRHDLRPLLNECENGFQNLATARGWSVTKRGWPDFLCQKDGEYIAVEVKPRTSLGRLQYLKPTQAETFDLLTKLGLKCYVSDGQSLERYDRAKHRPD